MHPVPYHLLRESVLTLLNSETIHLTKFASKKKGDHNVMVTGMTYELHPNIKSWPYLGLLSVISTSGLHPGFFIIKARVFILSSTSSRCLEILLPDPNGGGVRGGFLQSLLMKAIGGFTSRSTPIQDPVVVVWEGSPRLLLIKATSGSHGEWWAGQLARRSLSSNFEDVNISFNNLLYHSMSRSEGRVVTDKRWTW